MWFHLVDFWIPRRFQREITNCDTTSLGTDKSDSSDLFTLKWNTTVSYIESRFRILYVAMLVNFVIFGVTLTIIGATLPKIIGDFEWSYTATGAVISAGSIGYFVSTFVSGLFLRGFTPKQVIVTGLLIQALGLSFFALSPFVMINLCLSLLIGFGQGSTEVVVNLCVVRMERNGESRLMNLMHAAFCVGAIIGPFTVGRIIGAGLSWQMIYRLMAFLSILMAATLLFLPFSRLGRAKEKTERESSAADLLKHPLIILSFLMLFLYVGSELGTSAWIAEYYVKFLGTSASEGAYMVSVFWIGLLIGRLYFSGYRGDRQAEVMFILACTCTVSLGFALLMRGPWLAGAGFFLTGLGFSAIYPLVIALVGRYIQHGQSAAIGFVATGGGVGAFAFPFIMASLSDRFDIHRGFFFYVVLNVLMVVLSIAVIRMIRTIQREEKNIE